MDAYQEADEAEKHGWVPALATPGSNNGHRTPLAAATPPSPSAAVPAAANDEAGSPPLVASATAPSTLTPPTGGTKLGVVVSGVRDFGGDGGSGGRARLSVEVPAENGDTQKERSGDGNSGGSGSGSGSGNNASTPVGFPAPPGLSSASPAKASSTITTATSDLTHGGGSGSGSGDGRDGSDVSGEQRKRNRSSGGGSSSGGSSGRDGRRRTQPISPSGIRAILKGFSVLPWQFRDSSRDGTPWNFPPRAKAAAGATPRAPNADNPAPVEDPASASAPTGGAAADGELHGDDGAAAAAAAAAVHGGSSGVSGDEGVAAAATARGGTANLSTPSPSPSRVRGFLGTRWSASVGALSSPRIVRSHSMNLVSDIEEGKGRWSLRRAAGGGGESAWRWSTPKEMFGGGRAPRRGGAGGVGGAGGRSSVRPPRRGRSASFDHAAILEAANEDEEGEGRQGGGRGTWGAPWRMGGTGVGFPGAGGGGGWRGVQVRLFKLTLRRISSLSSFLVLSTAHPLAVFRRPGKRVGCTGFRSTIWRRW